MEHSSVDPSPLSAPSVASLIEGAKAKAKAKVSRANLTRCDSISRLAMDRPQGPDGTASAGTLAQQVRIEAMAASAALASVPSTPSTPDRNQRHAQDAGIPIAAPSPGLSNLLAALGLPDPTVTALQSPASSSPLRVTAAAGSALLQRRLGPQLHPPPASPFSLAGRRSAVAISATDVAHPLHYLAHAPEKILDAPGTSDDYYTHRLDWSAQNLVCVGLGCDAYVWNPDSGESIGLPPVSHSHATSPITALAFPPLGDHVAVANDAGSVAYYDVATHARVRSARPRFSLADDDATSSLSDLGVSALRITCMAWGGHGRAHPTLVTGDALGRVLIWDMRAPALTRLPATSRRVHAVRNPICGLAFNDNGIEYAAGGNDGLVSVWDRRKLDQPLVTWHHAHAGAVRALAWCPLRANVLVTGGGSADAAIKYWDTHTKHLIRQAHSGAQVTALRFLAHAYAARGEAAPRAPEPVLLAAYGYPSPTAAGVAEDVARLAAWQADRRVWSHAQAHAGKRVLDLSVSPGEDKMATLGADESLHVWRIRSMMDPPLPVHRDRESEHVDADENAPQQLVPRMLRRTRPADDVDMDGPVKRLRSFSWAAARKPSSGGFAARAAELMAKQQGRPQGEGAHSRGGLTKRRVLYFPPNKRPLSVR